MRDSESSHDEAARATPMVICATVTGPTDSCFMAPASTPVDASRAAAPHVSASMVRVSFTVSASDMRWLKFATNPGAHR